MRTLRYLLLFLFSLPLFNPALQAQAWLDPDGIFTFHLSGGFAGVSDYFNVKAGADTVINGRPCRNMTVAGAMFNYPQDRFAYVENDRVYAYQTPADSFVLIYDFNLLPGDTLHVPRLYSGAFVYRIDSIDVVQAGDFTVRRQLATTLDAGGLPTSWTFAVLEGLGMVGLSSQPGGPITCSYFFPDEIDCASVVDGFDVRFVCYRSPAGNYSLPGVDCALVDAPEPAQPTAALGLSPNPASERLLLTFSGAESDVLNTRVFSANGHCLFVQKGLPAEIGLASFSPGLYFLTVAIDNGDTLTRRFVKQ